MGTPGFTLVLTDDGLTFDNRTDRELPFPPRFIILDLQRVFYPWLDGPPPASGERSGQVAGERVHERYDRGRLIERTFERLDQTPPGLIRVTYEGYEPEAEAPARAELHNAWFGYRIVVETSDQTSRAADSSASARPRAPPRRPRPARSPSAREAPSGRPIRKCRTGSPTARRPAGSR
jgi:hypothetical protein